MSALCPIDVVKTLRGIHNSSCVRVKATTVEFIIQLVTEYQVHNLWKFESGPVGPMGGCMCTSPSEMHIDITQIVKRPKHRTSTEELLTRLRMLHRFVSEGLHVQLYVDDIIDFYSQLDITVITAPSGIHGLPYQGCTPGNDRKSETTVHLDYLRRYIDALGRCNLWSISISDLMEMKGPPGIPGDVCVRCRS